MRQDLEVSSSKSIYNRALILQSYFPDLKIIANSDSEDVLFLKNALMQLCKFHEHEFYVGEGGTTFRFLALRVSRLPGQWTVRGKPTLFSRPQGALQDLFEQLKVASEWGTDFVKIKSEGWQLPACIHVPSRVSSQFASSLLLNSFGLERELIFSIESDISSQSYFEMTLDFVRQFGLQVDEIHKDGKLRRFAIPALQKINKNTFEVEPDLSSIFTLAAFSSIKGDQVIKNFPFESKQPDVYFLELFREMNIFFERSGKDLLIKKTKNIKPIQANLKSSPDLFPVLACLCSRAAGVSFLYGTETLQYKESNRLIRTKELLDACGIRTDFIDGGIQIHGSNENLIPGDRQNDNQIIFDPTSDHRMAFAAALMKSMGFNINILHPAVVQKSFPDFWQRVGINP